MTVKKSLTEETDSLEFEETVTFSLRDLIEKKTEDGESTESENKSKPDDDLSPYNTSNS